MCISNSAATRQALHDCCRSNTNECRTSVGLSVCVGRTSWDSGLYPKLLPPYRGCLPPPSASPHRSFTNYSLLNKLLSPKPRQVVLLRVPKSQVRPAAASLQASHKRRDEVGLCVISKTLRQRAPHLSPRRQPRAKPHGNTTRAANTRDH
ncbi:hypothetical protein E2C01_027187 [Portunus trituberculatus]|uniref:Uncharacterized protein n=1 Tax=Portunus trituberculatus TaxID=210409 RepID=A0A5B7EI39_PORTR|nr:hypothetical protein [Portunus trituberculatus]